MARQLPENNEIVTPEADAAGFAVSLDAGGQYNGGQLAPSDHYAWKGFGHGDDTAD
jgi:hypothetical protein